MGGPGTAATTTACTLSFLPPLGVVAGEKIDPWHGSYHWVYERALSIASLALVGAAFATPHRLVDLALGIVFPLHGHVGFGAIVTDYLPARKFPRLNKLVMALLYAGTAGTIYGLYKYNTQDVGLTEGVTRLWTARRSPPETD